MSLSKGVENSSPITFHHKVVSRFKKILNHPMTLPIVKEICIFGSFFALFVAGAVCTIFMSHTLSPVNIYDLSGNKFLVIKMISLHSRIKTCIFLAIGGGASGIGSFGLVTRSANKILDLKEKVDAIVEKRSGQESVTRMQKALDKTLALVQFGLFWGNNVRDLKDHHMVNIMKVSLGIAFFIGGGGILSLSMIYILQLHQVISGIGGSGLAVKNIWGRLAVVGISRGGGLLGGVIFEISQMAIKQIGKKLKKTIQNQPEHTKEAVITIEVGEKNLL